VLQQLVDVPASYAHPLDGILEPAEALDRLARGRSRRLNEPRHGRPLLTDLDQKVGQAFEQDARWSGLAGAYRRCSFL
jgi:hypothetical protein